MTDSASGPSPRFYLWPLLTLFLCLLPWSFLEYGKAFNPDIFWLVTGAREFLAGRTMSTSFYDSNPPLSALVYIPLYLFSRLTGASLDAAAMVTTLACVFLGSAAVFLLVRRIIDGQEAFVLSVAFVLAGTALATAEFGQRDQLLALSLLPFILGQIILTYRISCSRVLLGAVFVTGAVLILLKPPFGLLPAACLIHRGIVQKRWSVIRDTDFLALAVAAVSYVTVVWFFFHDYAVIILPDVLNLYLGFDNDLIVAVYTAAFAVLYLAVWFVCRRTDKAAGKRATLMDALFACALLGLVPYAMQMKDYKYHLTPSLTFFWTATGLFIFITVQRVASARLVAMFTVALLSGAGYASEPPSSYNAGARMAALPLTRLVRNCGPDCSFMLFSASLPATMTTAYYAGRENASRFPSLWFLPQLLRDRALLKAGKPARIDEAEYERLFHKYARFLAEDIEARRPTLAIDCPQDFDSIGYFASDEGFARAWRAYAPDGKVSIDFLVYYPERRHGAYPVYSCDVYRRRS